MATAIACGRLGALAAELLELKRTSRPDHLWFYRIPSTNPPILMLGATPAPMNGRVPRVTNPFSFREKAVNQEGDEQEHREWAAYREKASAEA